MRLRCVCRAVCVSVLLQYCEGYSALAIRDKPITVVRLKAFVGTTNEGCVDKHKDEGYMKRGIDKEMLSIAFPAFIALAADPLASIVDAMYVID